MRLAAAFLAAICLLLSGCTGADAPEKPTEKETLTIGSDIYSPYFYLDDNGDFAGIDVEIAEEACRRLGVTPEFKQISWQNKDACLKSGTVDCLWGSFSMNGREDDYSWAGPYMYSRQVVVVKAASDIRTLKDLNGKNIAVQNATKPDELFSDDAISGVSVKKVYSFATMTDVFAALKKEYVDACAGHETACLDHIRNISGEYRVLDEDRNEVELIETSEYGNTDINAIIGNDKYDAFEDSESFEKHGFTKQEFDADNEELVNVEKEEEFDDSDEFFDDADEVLDEE